MLAVRTVGRDIRPRAGRNGVAADVLLDARTRDVSSTQIRARIAAEQDIDDLEPRGVARHIAANNLYTAVGELHG